MPIIFNKKLVPSMNVASIYLYNIPLREYIFSPIYLPNSEPQNPQIVFTITREDLPVFSHVAYNGLFIIYSCFGGKNVSSSSVALYVRVLINDAPTYYSSTSVNANYYHYGELVHDGINIGDTIGIKLWSSIANTLYYDYYLYMVIISRFYCKEIADRFVKVYLYGSYPYQVSIQPAFIMTYNLIDKTGGTSFNPYIVDTVSGVFRLVYGDVTYKRQISLWTSDTYRIRLDLNLYPRWFKALYIDFPSPF